MPTRRRLIAPRSSAVRGAALIVVLIFLVVTSLIGITSTSVSVAGTRSAGQWSDRQRALFLADTVAAQVTADIKTRVEAATGSVSTLMRAPSEGRYVRGDANVPNWMNWPADTACAALTVSGYPTARYFVIYEGEQPISGSTQLVFTAAVRATAKFNGTATVVVTSFALIPN